MRTKPYRDKWEVIAMEAMSHGFPVTRMDDGTIGLLICNENHSSFIMVCTSAYIVHQDDDYEGRDEFLDIHLADQANRDKVEKAIAWIWLHKELVQPIPKYFEAVSALLRDGIPPSLLTAFIK